MAHEVAHHLWRRGLFDESLIDLLAEGLEDHAELSEEAIDQVVKAYLDDLSFQYHGSAVPHAANIETEEERLEDEKLRRKLCDEFRGGRPEREDAKLASDPVFREEMYADFIAVQLCVRSFVGQVDLETIITAIQLVMENLTTIASVAEHTEKLLGFEVFEHNLVVNTRKRLVRDYLESEYDSRGEEAKAINPQSDKQTGHQITTATNIRYMRYVRDPIMVDVASKFTNELVLDDPDVLAQLRSKLTCRHGCDVTAQAMIKAKSFRYGDSESTET